ncbi:type I restriction endonuclease subunit S [Campylobacter helveticus]|uniref:restriction endonuclease subunit S n=1 Tax=Campylobacter helveticus TaxID=28898 RepID=UPI001116EF78|nr:restriction endonuclease subunit S [Campylobacter helveticus]TNH35067.1 type I restriction endonuclease subunit S [Campylobacter helveticus]
MNLSGGATSRLIASLLDSIQELESKLDFDNNNTLDLKTLFVSLPTPPAQGWDTKKLGQVCEILIGGTPARNNFSYFKGDNLWVSIAEMNGQIITDTKEKISDEAIKNSNVKLIPKNTTLLSFKLSIGKAAFAGKDLYTNEAIAGLIPKNKNNLLDKFLFFIFKWQTVDLDLKGNNAFGKSLNSSILKEKVKIPLPPLAAQENIIQTIEKLEMRIENFELLMENLESKKAEILTSFLESGI